VTQPIDPERRAANQQDLRWQSSAKWTLVAVVGVTVGMFVLFYVAFLRG